MNKHIFKLLFFIICLGVTNDILSMGDYGMSSNYREALYHGEEGESIANADGNELAKCPVCFDDIEKNHSHRLECGHIICKECLTSQLRVAYRENQLEQLRCPIPECKTNFTQKDYKSMKAFASYIN